MRGKHIVAIQISSRANPILRGGGGGEATPYKVRESQLQGGGVKAPPEVNPVLTRAIEFTSGEIPEIYHYIICSHMKENHTEANISMLGELS